jgi:MinD superfamily P-loop ATPase
VVYKPISEWNIGTRPVNARAGNTGKLVDLVREKAKQVAIEKNIETLFIDGPPGTGCPVISSVTGTDKAILVTEPTQTAFHDLKRIIEVVNNFKVKPFVVVNKYDLNLEMASVIEDWCQQNSIELAGRLPFNEAVVAAMVNCKSILEWQPDSGFSAEIRSILHKVITKK